METKFEVGDTVEWCGVIGVIKDIKDKIDYPVKCLFEDEYTVWFTSDGKYYNWHKEPSLKLIGRPKKKIKKYKVLYKNDCGIFFVSQNTYSDKEDFKSKSYKTVAFIQLIKESEIEVEE